MCGIVGYVGKKNSLPILIDGLKKLEYRGYDSAGVAFNLNNDIKIIKEKGKIVNLEKKITSDLFSNLGIGHTRWATHGCANSINSHPHQVNNITLVHNGIIENYIELKNELVDLGYHFQSETDTEIAAAYIDYLYKKENDILKTLNKLKDIFKGSYAFGILVKGNNNLYAIRKDSPLVIGISEDGNFISSDIYAILNYTNKYILLDNDEIALLQENNVSIYNDLKIIKKEVNTFNFDVNKAEKNGYDHFMLKEINEEDILAKNLIDEYLTNKDDFIKKLPDLKKYERIDIVACGSAYHAGLIGKVLIEEFGDTFVNVYLASEYRYKKLFLNDKVLVIAISQSGETADTLASVRIAKENKVDTLGIVNVFNSSIARECDNVIYIKAGVEVAVATTKAYSLQLLILSFIALKLGLEKNIINDKKFNEIKNEYQKLPLIMRKEIDKDYQKIAKKIYNKKDIFYIGRNIDYYLAMEGSLKLKEISYIHSESYAAGELKHGTISLIEDNTLVIAIATDKSIFEKTISNIKEVKARGAYVIFITTNPLDIDDDFYDEKIVTSSLNKLVDSLITIIPLQIISYYVAKENKCDIDKPRNLAKSVTVE